MYIYIYIYIYNTCALSKHISNMFMRLRNGGKGVYPGGKRPYCLDYFMAIPFFFDYHFIYEIASMKGYHHVLMIRIR